VNRAFYFLVAGTRTASRIRVIAAAQLYHIARIVLDYLIATNDVAKSQPNLPAGLQAEELARCLFEKVFPLDPELTRKWHVARTEIGAIRMIHRLHDLYLIVRVTPPRFTNSRMAAAG
jgi:hypothetical protein